MLDGSLSCLQDISGSNKTIPKVAFFIHGSCTRIQSSLQPELVIATASHKGTPLRSRAPGTGCLPRRSDVRYRPEADIREHGLSGGIGRTRGIFFVVLFVSKVDIPPNLEPQTGKAREGVIVEEWPTLSGRDPVTADVNVATGFAKMR